MSTALAKITLTALPNGVTYACMLSCTMGDVLQRYSATRIVPDWETDPTKCPVLTLHCISSNDSTGETIPANIKLFLDNTEVTFAAGQRISSDGMFELIGGVTDLWKIKILKNYVQAGSAVQAGHTLRVVGELADGNKVACAVALQASVLSESGTSVTITGSGDNPFVVDQNLGNSTKLKAVVYEGGEPVATPIDYTFKWYQMGLTDWELIAGATSDELTVSADMVESYAEFKVEAIKGAEKYSDTQSVMDVGDPYFAAIETTDGVSESTGTFGSSPQPTDKRVLKVVLYSRKSNQPVSNKIKHSYWKLTLTDGVLLNASYTGGKDANGVWDSQQDKREITIPYKYLTDNGIQTLDAYAVVEY